MIDAVKALLYIKPAMGPRVGLIAMSGGQSVVITDTFAKSGLDVPLLSQSSYERLANFFDIIGGSYRNPFDISSTFLMAYDGIANLANMLDVMDQDPNIDSIVLELFPVVRPFDQSSEVSEDLVLNIISDYRVKSHKPFMVIVTSVHNEALASDMRDKLMGKGIPNYPSFERGAKALKKLVEYYRLRQVQSKNQRDS